MMKRWTGFAGGVPMNFPVLLETLSVAENRPLIVVALKALYALQGARFAAAALSALCLAAGWVQS
jgi:hypothetical protein